MAWTAPLTFVAATALTAAQLNQQLRDNLLETMPGKATTPGSFFVVNSISPVTLGERQLQMDSVMESDSTAGTSYADLDNGTVGPTVTVTTGTRAFVWFSCRLYNDTANAQICMTYAVSGATTVAASDTSALIVDGLATANRQTQAMYDMTTGLTAGSNTFTAKYRAGGGGRANYFWRRLGVWPL